MLPPAVVQNQTKMVNGRTYSGTPGTVQDVDDFDAGVLGANGWIQVCPSGPTSARPTGALVASRFFDTTINLEIIYDGATWRSPVDGSSV